MCSQSANHRINLVGEQDKISGDSGLALARWLEVDGCGNSHCGRNLHCSFGDLLYPGNGELQDASVDFSGVTESLLDLPCIKVDALLRCRWCCRHGCCRRSLCQSNGGGERTR